MSNVTQSSGLACLTYLVWGAACPGIAPWRGQGAAGKATVRGFVLSGRVGSSKWSARRFFRNSQTRINAPGNREGLRNASPREVILRLQDAQSHRRRNDQDRHGMPSDMHWCKNTRPRRDIENWDAGLDHGSRFHKLSSQSAYLAFPASVTHGIRLAYCSDKTKAIRSISS